jgi:hypothetical protein
MTTTGIRVVLTAHEGRKLFEEQLPLSGVIERELASVDGNSWSLMLLDRAFDYQVQDPQTKAFRGFEVKRLLVRSRWQGYAVGGSEPTSVFVLIAGDESLFSEEKVDPKKFYFDAWAMCENEKRGYVPCPRRPGIKLLCDVGSMAELSRLAS